jgi:hypothetical protein
MPELRKLIPTPPPTGEINLPTEGPSPFLDRVLAGAMGDQQPGDMASMMGATFSGGLLNKILSKLRMPQALTKAHKPSNPGDMILREHLAGSPRMREFTAVGDEVVKAPGATGPDALEEAYKRILNGGGRVKPSPPGSGPKPEAHQPVEWPKPEDVERLKTRYGRRKLESGRPLDK